MDRVLRLTEDGSHTMFVPGLDEPFHSTHGALQESMHVFIKQGLLKVKTPSVRVLELGFGTGLNALLTMAHSIRYGRDIHYHTVEKYPLTEQEYNLLNHESFVDHLPKGSQNSLHDSPWGEIVKITDRFTLFKEKADFRSMCPPANINLVYFDAFSPDKQPELWTMEVIASVAEVSVQGAILVTYSSKGMVRRTLASTGFDVTKVPGPPGKREMILATKR